MYKTLGKEYSSDVTDGHS